MNPAHTILVLTAFVTAMANPCTVSAAAPQAALESLFKTYGGKDYLRHLNGMRLQFAGEIHNPWQSRSSITTSPISTSHRYSLDWTGNRELADTDFNFPGGHRIHQREIRNAAQSLVADLATRSVAATNGHYRLPAAVRFHPLLLARELARDDVHIRQGAPVSIQGKTFDVLSTSRKDGPTLDILLTRENVRIGGVRYRSWAADNERVMATQLFANEENNAPYFPRMITGFVATSRVQTWQYRITEATPNPSFEQEEFDAPRGYLEGQASTPGSTIQLGKGVHLVRGLQNDDYNALVLEFKDYLAIVEAPIDRGAGEELRQIARKIAPTKPLKYLILSHHHADHIGGAAPLIEPGTEVIAPTAARPFIEAVRKAGNASARYTFRGLAPATRHSIGDETLRVDLYALRGNPHADDMLFVYLPEHKLVFQADMFFFQDPDRLSYPLNERGFAFFHSLQLLGLDFNSVAGTHGVTVPRKTVEQLIGK